MIRATTRWTTRQLAMSDLWSVKPVTLFWSFSRAEVGLKPCSRLTTVSLRFSCCTWGEDRLTLRPRSSLRTDHGGVQARLGPGGAVHHHQLGCPQGTVHVSVRGEQDGRQDLGGNLRQGAAGQDPEAAGVGADGDHRGHPAEGPAALRQQVGAGSLPALSQQLREVEAGQGVVEEEALREGPTAELAAQGEHGGDVEVLVIHDGEVGASLPGVPAVPSLASPPAQAPPVQQARRPLPYRHEARLPLVLLARTCPPCAWQLSYLVVGRVAQQPRLAVDSF